MSQNQLPRDRVVLQTMLKLTSETLQSVSKVRQRDEARRAIIESTDPDRKPTPARAKAIKDLTEATNLAIIKGWADTDFFVDFLDPTEMKKAAALIMQGIKVLRKVALPNQGLESRLSQGRAAFAELIAGHNIHEKQLRELQRKVSAALNKLPEAQGAPEDIPHWNDAQGELWFRETMVRKIAGQSKRMRPVLAAFEAAGWPEQIVMEGVKHAHTAHNTVDSLNKGLKLLKFSARVGYDQHGRKTWGIVWEVKSKRRNSI